jgi:hypothetical protein
MSVSIASTTAAASTWTDTLCGRSLSGNGSVTSSLSARYWLRYLLPTYMDTHILRLVVGLPWETAGIRDSLHTTLTPMHVRWGERAR